MLKCSIVSAVVGSIIPFLLLLSACDTGGDGTINSCPTALVGSFEGGRQGPMIGAVQLTPPTFESGALFVIMAPDDVETEFRGESTLMPDGTISGSGLLAVSGAMDLDDCSASGDWALGTATGTWSMRVREPAF